MGSSVELSLGEDTDVSDSETEEYVHKVYEELKNGKHLVKISDHVYTCPYCTSKKKIGFPYKGLLQHSSSIGSSSSKKRNAKDKSNHLALAKYLEQDMAVAVDDAGPSKPSDEAEKDMSVDDAGPSKPSGEVDALAEYDRDELFVWPWFGIVVNIPTHFKDGRSSGESGSNLRDLLIERGFNPEKVKPLWNYQGHSGTAIVIFDKNRGGFINAMNFETYYVVNQHGKKNWLAKEEKKSDLYAWVARADDYNSNNIVGENLRKIGNLRTLKDIEKEEDRKTNMLIGNLTKVNEALERRLLEVGSKFEETETSLRKVIMEKDAIHQSYNEEMKEIASSAQAYYRKIVDDHEKMKFQLETQKKELEIRGQELMKRETHNEIERKNLAEELEQNAVKNCSLQAATEEQRKADEKVIKLAEAQRKEKERLHEKTLQLEKQLAAKQAVQLEIEQLRGQLNVAKHTIDEGDLEVLNKVEMMQEAMREKEAELDDLKSMNQVLITKERICNDELQDARKEMINGLKEKPIKSHIGVKRMGELDSEPFHRAMKRKYNEAEAEERASELCSLWQEYLKDPEWLPIKVVSINGKPQAVLKEGDEKLRDLKRSYGAEVHDAVAAAAFEIYEYNPSGMYITSELWNYNDGKRAMLKEGVEVLLKQLKSLSKK